VTILTLPASLYAPTAAAFRPIYNSQTMVSPLNRATQTLELPGAIWACDATWSNVTQSQWRLWEAIKAQLRGQVGRFYFSPPHAKVPQGVATGTPLVNGGSQTGASLATKGWTHSITGILKIGDYLSFDTPGGWRELHLVVSADVNSDGSGNATITIEPPIRTSPADAAAITVQSPTCIMRLVGDDIPINFQKPVIAGFTLQMVEAFS
jgi:hypothetical protein